MISCCPHYAEVQEPNMGTLLMRQMMPERRHSWTQKVRIDGQTVYMTVGEYDDGRPGEIFIDVSKQGTFLRGVMGSLARMVSIALQCGASVDVIIHALRGLDYPPNGRVEGSPTVTECLSVTDWVAAELEAGYINSPLPNQPQLEDLAGKVLDLTEKGSGW